MQRNIKFKFILICMLALLTIPAHQAHAQRDQISRGSNAICKDQEPKVIVKLATSKTKYYKNYDARTINSIHNAQGGGTVLGLAGGPIEITTRGEFLVRGQNGKACVQLNNIEVLFWAKPVIIIASNFEKGTCEYREVFAHEQRHIRTTRTFIRKYAPKLKKEVKEIIRTSRHKLVVTEDRIGDAQRKLQEPIAKRIAEFQNRIVPILQSAQAEIDTAEEYKKVSDKCENWGKRLSSGG